MALSARCRRLGPQNEYGGDAQALRAVEEALTNPRAEVERLLASPEGPDLHIGRAEVRIGEVTLPIG